MKIGLLTDSNSNIDYDYARSHNIKVVPLSATFNGEEHLEDEDFDLDAYYKNFEEQELFRVQTSQPSPGSFVESYEELISEGYDHIISINVSSGLSGTYNSAQLAARQVMDEHEDVTIEVIDSRLSSIGIVYLVEKAVELLEEGVEFDEIVERTRNHREDVVTILSLPTLKYLRASGRVSFPKFIIGRLFGLKPLVQVNEEGKNNAIGTTFSLEKGNRKVVELTRDEDMGGKTPSCYTISHTYAPERADEIEAIIREEEPDVEVRKVLTGPTVSAHTGIGAIALITRFE